MAKYFYSFALHFISVVASKLYVLMCAYSHDFFMPSSFYGSYMLLWSQTNVWRGCPIIQRTTPCTWVYFFVSLSLLRVPLIITTTREVDTCFQHCNTIGRIAFRQRASRNQYISTCKDRVFFHQLQVVYFFTSVIQSRLHLYTLPF